MSDTPPTVSCVLVTYNHERWIRDAIDSILAQEFPGDGLELIVLDNGSTDDTPAILGEYADRAEIHLLEGGPLNDAWNLGLSRVRGAYFTVFSGDDVWTPGRLADMLELFETRPEVGLVYGDMEVIDGDGEVLHPSWKEAHSLPVHEGRMLGRQLSRNLVFGPAMLIRGSLLPAVAPIPAQAAWEDWWFGTAVARVAEIAFTPRPVSRYRRHPGAMSNLGSEAKRIAFLKEDLRFRGWLLQTLAPGDASPAELLEAVDAQIAGVMRLAELQRRPPESVMGIGSTAQRLAHQARRRADAAGSAPARLAWLAQAVGHDPTDVRTARRLIAAAAAADADGTAPPLGPVRPGCVLEGVRAHVTLALAAELISTPALLAGYLRETHPEAPATLAIYAVGEESDALSDAVDAAQAEAGLSDGEMPDLLLVVLADEPGVRAALAVRADDLLTAGGAHGWPWAGMAAARPFALSS